MKLYSHFSFKIYFSLIKKVMISYLDVTRLISCYIIKKNPATTSRHLYLKKSWLQILSSFQTPPDRVNQILSRNHFKSVLSRSNVTAFTHLKLRNSGLKKRLSVTLGGRGTCQMWSEWTALSSTTVTPWWSCRQFLPPRFTCEASWWWFEFLTCKAREI